MGYAKIDRKIANSEIFLNDKLLAFYVRLILICRIKPCVIDGVLISPGQLLTSVRKLAGDLNMPASNAFRQLRTLEEKHLISVEKSREGSLITVLNYNCDKKIPEKAKQQNECFAKQIRNTSETPTLLYNKQDKQVEQGVPRAQKQNQIFDGSAIFGGGLGEKISEKENSDEKNNSQSINKFLIPTRESLVERYGEENVADYEIRFERWKNRQNKHVDITCYEAIERWMRVDKVQHPCSEAAFNTEEIINRVIKNYNP